MSRSAGCIRLLALAGIILMMSGCLPNVESQSEEQLEAHFQSGQSRVKTMDYAGAAQAFERALEVNPQNASAHYELGLIYDQKEVDPAAAIYHYNRYLQLRPKAGNAEMIRSRVVACKQELASTISLSPATLVLQNQVQRLAEENRSLREELDRWRAYAQKLQLLTNPPPLRGASTPLRQEPPEPGPVAQTVIPGNPPGSTSGFGAPQPSPGQQQLASASEGSRATPTGSQARVRSTTESSRIQPDVTRSAGAASTSRTRTASSTGPSRYHEMKSNETPTSIARRYGISTEKLLQANPRLDPRRPRTGQTLVIPGA